MQTIQTIPQGESLTQTLLFSQTPTSRAGAFLRERVFAFCTAMNRFIDRMSAVLGVPVDLATRFREVPDWSSLVGFGVLVTLENDFGRRMSVGEFSTLNTIGELAAACGIAEGQT